MLLLGSCLSGLNQPSTPNTAIFKSSNDVPVFDILVMCKVFFLLISRLRAETCFTGCTAGGTNSAWSLQRMYPRKLLIAHMKQDLVLSFTISCSPFSSPGEQVLLIIPVVQMSTMMLRKVVARPGHKGSKRGINQDSCLICLSASTGNHHQRGLSTTLVTTTGFPYFIHSKVASKPGIGEVTLGKPRGL